MRCLVLQTCRGSSILRAHCPASTIQFTLRGSTSSKLNCLNVSCLMSCGSQNKGVVQWRRSGRDWELDTTCLKNMPPSEGYSSCEEKKKRLVAIKSEGSSEREAEFVQFYEINENEHVGMRWPWLNLKKKLEVPIYSRICPGKHSGSVFFFHRQVYRDNR